MEDIPIVAARIFDTERVVLSGTKYVDCVFRNCTLVFDGRPISMDGCDISHCGWELAEKAGETIGFLRTMWAQGSRVLPAQAIGAIIGMDPKEALERLTGSTDLPNDPPR